MSSQELFNDLLALRISLQEDHSDETFIIRELKMFLISRNIPPNNINQVVKEFYQSFDINFENGLAYKDGYVLVSNTADPSVCLLKASWAD